MTTVSYPARVEIEDGGWYFFIIEGPILFKKMGCPSQFESVMKVRLPRRRTGINASGQLEITFPKRNVDAFKSRLVLVPHVGNSPSMVDLEYRYPRGTFITCLDRMVMEALLGVPIKKMLPIRLNFKGFEGLEVLD